MNANGAIAVRIYFLGKNKHSCFLPFVLLFSIQAAILATL